MSDSLPVSVQLRLEESCAHFEAAWRAAGPDAVPPHIEDHLTGAAGSERQALLWELLLLDVHYRRCRGERPAPADYAARFPQDGALIPGALTAAGLPATGSASPAPATLSNPHGADTPTGPDQEAAGAPAFPTIPGYEVLGELGKGGMGEVVWAHDLHMGRDLAVKVLPEKYRDQPHLARRFVREARIHGRLQHPGIAPIHELGELSDRRPYFTMKLVEGRTLADLLAERAGPDYDLPRFLTVFEQVCQAVAYAHSQGVIHRDLKPRNVMVGSFGEVQVMDWGLAKVLAEEAPEAEGAGGPGGPDADGATQAGAVLGTYSYIAPEQARGELERVGRRSDVFGLGAILCEVLTGQPPYAGTPQDRADRAERGDVAPALRRLGACGADAELVDLARRCLSARPEERPADAAAVAAAVAGYQAGVQERLRAAELERATAAVQAREEKARATAAAERRARRLALGLVAALAVGIAATGYFLFLATGAADKAEGERLRAEDLAGKEKVAREDAEEQKGLAQAEKRTADQERQKADGQKQQAVAAKHDADEARKLADTYRTRAEGLFYAGQIAHAHRAWQYGDLLQAKDLLDACQQDRRGWEHAYVSALVKRTARVLPGHVASVLGAHFSPDGKRLSTFDRGGTLKVWDPETGREIRTLKAGVQDAMAVCFSPDGKCLTIAHRTGATVWDEEKRQEIHTALKGDRSGDTIACACFSLDGKRLARVFEFPHARTEVWDTEAGHKVCTLRGGGTGIACFSPDGKRLLASAGGEETVVMFDAATGEELYPCTEKTGGFTSVCFSPDGKLFVGGGRDGTVSVWDARTGVYARALKGHTHPVTRVCFSPDGRRLASAAQDATRNGRNLHLLEVKVWDTETWQGTRSEADSIRGQWQEVRSLQGHDPLLVTNLCFSPDGERLAITSGNWGGRHGNRHPEGEAAVWQVAARQEARTFEAHQRALRSVIGAMCFTPDGRRLVTAGMRDRGAVKMWDARTGEQVQDFGMVHGGEVSGLCYSPDGKRLASSGRTVKVWDAATSRESLTIDHIDPHGWLNGVCFSPDGRLLATASGFPHFWSRDGAVKVWDAQTGKEALALKGRNGAATSVCFSPDGKLLAGAGADGTVRVWNVATGEEALALQGHTLVGADWDARMWGATQRQEVLAEWAYNVGVLGVCFSPDGQRLASAGGDGTVRVWDAATGREVFNLQGHPLGVLSICFSPDGKRLASALGDGTLKVWDAETGQETLTLNERTGVVLGVCFSPDGQRLAGACIDGTVKLWEATPP
jgi:WD40 repeat protein/tRNA A-37 threonylcarbamoyl transferase component Bud32